jgi:hypothetical protein
VGDQEHSAPGGHNHPVTHCGFVVKRSRSTIHTL